MVQGLTSSDPYEQAGLLQVLLRMQCGNGLMHESVHVSDGLCFGCAACVRGHPVGCFNGGSDCARLTSGDPYEQAGLLQVLLRMQCGNGLMHESVHVSGGYILWMCCLRDVAPGARCVICECRQR
jgi:hypothetical protein